MRKKIGFLLTFFLIVLGTIFFWSTSNDKCLSPNINTEKIVTTDFPSYLYRIWPRPKSRITFFCYLKSLKIPFTMIESRGINVEIHPSTIIDLKNYQQNDFGINFEDNVYLYIDGKLISNRSRVVYDNLIGIGVNNNGLIQIIPDISEGYVFSWTPLLLPGSHLAKLVINSKSGEKFEYEWNFVIW